MAAASLVIVENLKQRIALVVENTNEFHLERVEVTRRDYEWFVSNPEWTLNQHVGSHGAARVRTMNHGQARGHYLRKEIAIFKPQINSMEIPFSRWFIILL
ncbi:hypothetical protein Fot_03003 [Forsythia ovata]|uniref:Uncharacterized protein n=1 Tax=Forsythia ovata TaxID=205694 RepID=A0ABD1X8H2_9LAMI